MASALETAWQSVRGMWVGFLEALPLLAIGLVVFGLFTLVGSVLRRFVRKATEERRHKNLGLVLGRLTQAALILVGFIIGVTIVFPGVDAGNLVALLGLSSVAIGFAFKDILQNLLAGILILLQQPFKEGDEIIHGDHVGTVDRIETRATKIRTPDGRQIIIPNAELYTDPVLVETAYDKRRSEYDVGVTYDVSSERGREALLDAVRGVEGVLSDPAPEALVVDLAPSTMNVRIRWWTKAKRSEVVHTRARVLAAVKDHMAAEDIDLPFPIRTVILQGNAPGATEGNGGGARRERYAERGPE